MSSVRHRLPDWHGQAGHYRTLRQFGSKTLPYVQSASLYIGRSAFYILKFPGVFPVAAFIVLYQVAAHQWCRLYCGGWEPAWPEAWRVFFILLIITPAFALTQLLWLLAPRLLACLFQRANKRRNTGSTYSALQSDGEMGETAYVLMEERSGNEWEGPEDAHGVRRPRQSAGGVTSSYRKFLRGIPGFWNTLWWAQIILYSGLIGVGINSVRHYEYEGDVRYRPAIQHALAQHNRDPAGYAKGENIFIAAIFYQNQDILPYWSRSLLDTIAYLGSAHVYVSIVESNSNDRTPEYLRELDRELQKLNVPHRILIQDDAVKRPADMSWNARIDFLSATRNRAMEPLLEAGGYDKVIFSNDVFIEPETIIELLETAGGDFDFACGMDFGHFGAYDAWVLRDRMGHLTAGIWPYFFDAADYEAVKKEEPVPVFTCWNGIVAFQADPLLPVHLRSNRTLSTSPLTKPLPPAHPMVNKLGSSPAVTPPLAFRSSAPGECYSSESFLLPYDFRRVMNLERIYMNSRVITGYVWRYYVWHKWVLRQRYMKWFVEKVYDGAWMQYTRMIVGEDSKVSSWDGGDCHPWW